MGKKEPMGRMLCDLYILFPPFFRVFDNKKGEKQFKANGCVFSHQLKDASVIDARPTAPTIGNREATTHKVGICSCNTRNRLVKS